MTWRKEGKVFVGNCACGALIKSKPYYLERHSGKCLSCAHKKPPFVHLYNKLKNTAKHEQHQLDLTFEEFLQFTKINNCHYCGDVLDWQPFCYNKGAYKSGSYFLDRKVNNLGYSMENCVACCTRCNMAKGSRFSYEEWKEMTLCLKSKQKSTTTPEFT